MIPAEETRKSAIAISPKDCGAGSPSGEGRVDKPNLEVAATPCPATAYSQQGGEYFNKQPQISKPRSRGQPLRLDQRLQAVGVPGTLLPRCRPPCGDQPQHHQPDRAAGPSFCRGAERGQATGQAVAAAGNQGLAAGGGSHANGGLRSAVDEGRKAVIERDLSRFYLLEHNSLAA
jgi:hypothetical protein